MKVSIYLTQFSENLKNSMLTYVQDMAAQVTAPFRAKTQIICYGMKGR